MPALIILVGADRSAVRRTEVLLATAGYLVAPAVTFHDGKLLIHSISPDLLIPEARLDAFNGLHLAAHSRKRHPAVPVIVTTRWHDPVLEREANGFGATVMVHADVNPEFLRHVHATIVPDGNGRKIRRWHRNLVQSVVPAQLAGLQARVVDMSYGGLRLAFDDAPEVPSQFPVTVSVDPVTVKAQRVWTAALGTGEFWCGAELTEHDPAVLSGWRKFVDSVS